MRTNFPSAALASENSLFADLDLSFDLLDHLFIQSLLSRVDAQNGQQTDRQDDSFEVPEVLLLNANGHRTWTVDFLLRFQT